MALTVLEQLAADLDALMTARGLTQDAVHRRAHVGENTVSRILRARDCRVSTLVRVGQSLGVDVCIVLRPAPPSVAGAPTQAPRRGASSA
jgi:transcriptional regulator with XRE-family HTH domain